MQKLNSLDPIEDPIQLITYNLSKLHQEFLDLQHLQKTQNQLLSEHSTHSLPHNHSSLQSSSDSRSCTQGEGNQQIEKAIILHLSEQYSKFMEQIGSGWSQLPHNQRLLKLIKMIESKEENNSVGTLIYLFELLYHFKQQFDPALLSSIIPKVAQGIGKGVKGFCVLQILALLGQSSQQQLTRIGSVLLDEQEPLLQEKAFLCLFNLGYAGFYTLMDLANKDLIQLNRLILSLFALTKKIQQHIFVPLILSQISSKDSKVRAQALAVLNRLNPSSIQNQSVRLCKLLHNHPQPQLLSVAVKGSGQKGVKALVRQLRSLPWKVKQKVIQSLGNLQDIKQTRLKIQIVNNRISKFPGRLFKYNGPLGIFSSDQQIGTLQIDSIDFTASLHRFMAEEFQNYSSGRKQPNNPFAEGFQGWFTLLKVIKSKCQQEEMNQNYILRGILPQLNSQIASIRQEVLLTISRLHNINFIDGTQKLLKALSDKDSKVKLAACQVIARSSDPPLKLIDKLIQLLRDPFWNVRVGACTTLGTVVREPNQNLLQGLVKCLKDGSINRSVVCSTLSKFGNNGIKILLNIIKIQSLDFKLKLPIIVSLKEVILQQPLLDHVLQELFRQARDKQAEVRICSLRTLQNLQRIHSESSSVYLRSRTLLPFYYELLADNNQAIRICASQVLLTYGSQAQLLLVQGLTKDKNINVRISCAKALGSLGPQNFRALLFGLRDQQQKVRRASCNALLQLGSAQQIARQFKQKINIISSMLNSIEEVIRLGPNKNVQRLLLGVTRNLQAIRGRQNKENNRINMQ